MKKFLLSLAVAAGIFTTAGAATTTLDVVNAADVVGTDIPEVPAEEGKSGSGRHVQPLESMTIDGFTFTFSAGTSKTAPAYYYPMSTNENGKRSIRLYNGNTMTVTAPAGTTFKTVTAVPDNSTNEVTLYSGEAVSTFTFTATATTRINTITFSDEAGTTPVDPTPVDPTPTPGDGNSFCVDDATDIVGTDVAETPASGSSNGQARHIQPLESLKLGGYTYTFATGSSKTAPAYYYPMSTNENGKRSIRIYNGNTMTVTAPAGTTFKSVTAVPDNSTTAVTLYSGEAVSTFTFTATATTRIYTITFSDEAGTTPVDPTPTPGNGDTVSVDDATDIVGTDVAEVPKSDSSNGQARHFQPLESLKIGKYSFTFTSGTNEKTAPAYYYPMSTNENGKRSIRLYNGNTMTITATDGATFTTVTAVPDNSTTPVTLYSGEAVSTFTFTATATTRINTLTFSDGQGGGTVTSVKSVADVLKLANGTSFTVEFPLTVAFVSGKNVFATDAAGDFIQLYGENTYAVDDIVPAGWNAVYELYNNNTPELKPAAAFPASTEKGKFVVEGIFDPAKVTTALVNSVVMLKNVVFATATPDAKENFDGVMEGTTLSFRNNYTIAGVEAGTYDVVVVVTIYKEEPSLYVVSYNTPSAVEAIDADAAEAVYFNLNGVRVDNPANGLFIKVTGNKAEKVIIR